jgi:hypothetical protein
MRMARTARLLARLSSGSIVSTLTPLTRPLLVILNLASIE